MITFKAYRDLEGSFNKDEQGWCGYRIEVACTDGKNVTYSKYYDRNGIIEGMITLSGQITNVESDIVHISLENGHLLEYSLKEKKLIKY